MINECVSNLFLFVAPQISGNIRDLNQAWDLYYHVFRRISRQLPQLTSLELQYVSPKLLACKDLELAVPGSYTPGQDIIRIANIHQNLQVNIESLLLDEHSFIQQTLKTNINICHIDCRSLRQSNALANFAYAAPTAKTTCSC